MKRYSDPKWNINFLILQAKIYHPDKNPDDPNAETMVIINLNKFTQNYLTDFTSYF